MENSNTTKVFIIGGSGFVGLHLLNRLTSRTDLEIMILSRKPSSNSYNKVTTVYGDLADYQSLKRATPDGPIVLINLAYDSSNHSNNIQYARNISKLISEKEVTRLIHLSTAVIVGKCDDDIITEDTLCNPLNEYEKTKFEVEKIFTQLSPEYLEMVIIRPAAIVGPGGENLKKMFKDLTTKSLWINDLKSFFHGHRCFNLVSVYHVVELINCAVTMKLNQKHEIIISADDSTPINTFKNVETLFRKKLNLKPAPSFELPSCLRGLVLAIANRSNTSSTRKYLSSTIIKYEIEQKTDLQMALERFISSEKEKCEHSKC